jgi:hypothetical protein
MNAAFADDFEGTEVDTSVWLPHYLPMWSWRAEADDDRGMNLSGPGHPESS